VHNPTCVRQGLTLTKSNPPKNPLYIGIIEGACPEPRLTLVRGYPHLPASGLDENLKLVLGEEMIYTGIMSGIIQFTIKKDEDGVYCAKAVDHPIFTFGKTLPELENNIREAAALYIEDAPEQRLPWS